jgi:hypothetical protein
MRRLEADKLPSPAARRGLQGNAHFQIGNKKQSIMIDTAMMVAGMEPRRRRPAHDL